MRQRKLSRGEARGEWWMLSYVYTRQPFSMYVCRPVAYIFFDARKRNPELEASRVFPVRIECEAISARNAFPSIPRTRWYSLPRRDRLNQFQLPLYTLTRFRGRISKVCKATDLDFHGNLDALRLPSPTHSFNTVPDSFRDQQQNCLPLSLIPFFIIPVDFYLLPTREKI